MPDSPSRNSARAADTRPDRVEPRPPAPLAARRATLMRLFPEAVVEGELDWDRLKAAAAPEGDPSPDRYAFTWAGKRQAVRTLHEPAVGALVPQPEQSRCFDDTEHSVVEGENLEVLKLLQPSYAGQAGLIYLDPPYNTGSDFVYPDDFGMPLERYRRLTGQTDAGGRIRTSADLDRPARNSTRSGGYHSAWLSMLYPRLILARQLLREDGLLCVSIDDHEVHHLRLLLNEVFGEDNFLGQVVWQRHAGGGNDSRYFAVDHEYVLVYARERDAVPRLRLPLTEADRAGFTGRDEHFEHLGGFKTKTLRRLRPDDPRPGLRYPIQTPDGSEIEDEWKWEEGRFRRAFEEGRIRFRRDLSGRWQVEYKLYERSEETGEARARVPRSLATDLERNADGRRQLREALGEEPPFPNPKPVGLIRHFLRLCPDPDALVMDFFAGSGTTAQAVMEQNREDGGRRRFLLVQLPEPLDHPEFPTLAALCRERIARVQQRTAPGTHTPAPADGVLPDAGFRAYRLVGSHLRRWEAPASGISAAGYLQQLSLFEDPLVEGWSEVGVLAELALREGLGLCARWERREIASNLIAWRISACRKSRSLVACLAPELRPHHVRALVAALALGSRDHCVCRDSALNDPAATALARACRLTTL